MQVAILIPIGIALGISVAIFFSIRELIKGKQAANWPIASGRVTMSDVSRSVSRSRDGDRSVTWRPDVLYEYEVDGRQYEADKVSSLNFYSSNRRAAYRTVHKYQVGKEVDVYYNPDDPTDALLEPGVTFSGVVLVVVLFIFLGVVAFLLVSAGR